MQSLISENQIDISARIVKPTFEDQRLGAALSNRWWALSPHDGAQFLSISKRNLSRLITAKTIRRMLIGLEIFEKTR